MILLFGILPLCIPIGRLHRAPKMGKKVEKKKKEGGNLARLHMAPKIDK